MTLDCAAPSPDLEKDVLKEQTILNHLPSLRDKKLENDTIGHITPTREKAQGDHQHLHPTVRDTYEVKAGILVDGEVLYTNRDLGFIVEIERTLTRMGEYLGMPVLKEVLELEVISSQHKFLEFYELLNEFSSICDILHKNWFHLKRTNVRCGCVILSVFAVHMRHPPEVRQRNAVQRVPGGRVDDDQKNDELSVPATLPPGDHKSTSCLGETQSLETSYSSLKPISPGFSQHRQTRSPQASNSHREFVVPSPIEPIKVSMYKPAIDPKGTIASHSPREQGASNNASPLVNGILRTPERYTPTKSVRFTSPKNTQPAQNTQRTLPLGTRKLEHPGFEAITFRIVKRKHSDVARDPSRPFCEISTELNRENDMRARIYHAGNDKPRASRRKTPRNPAYRCPPPPPNTPTGLSSQVNIETLAMELHRALMKINTPSPYSHRSPAPPNNTPPNPKLSTESPFASIDDSSPIQPVFMYSVTPPPTGRMIVSSQEASQPGLESSLRFE
ncbi:hypothetical protein P167DRAFT_577870 [Morchella conica CCBAS932]|uniref:Uncharacterized protein n=1 Tax=Morchella conica CCBAS932 TaxID=1392247 RepID=A0A3N4KE85_9PEZI|nr:hypothetical protein P167DRAFT_577870 [Morchella conica CCBAS932]